MCVCVHHNTVDTNAQVALQQLQEYLGSSKHALFAFEKFSEATQVAFDAQCETIPELLCAAIACTNVPFKGFCWWAKIIVIFVNRAIIWGLGTVYAGKPIPHQSVYDLFIPFHLNNKYLFFNYVKSLMKNSN